MIPKVETCIYSLEQGVEGVVTIDARPRTRYCSNCFTNQGTAR